MLGRTRKESQLAEIHDRWFLSMLTGKDAMRFAHSLKLF